MMIRTLFISLLCSSLTNTFAQDSLDENLTSLRIGRYTVLSKNLAVMHFRNGDSIPQARSVTAWIKASKAQQPAWCYYQNKEQHGETFGIIYNGYAVADPRGLAPEGWHIPNNEEWDRIRRSVGGGNKAGIRMKSTSDWERLRSGASGNGNNRSGFTGLPGGMRNYDGRFKDLNRSCYVWSSTPFGKQDLWGYQLYYWFDEFRAFNCNDMGNGMYVRCIKD